MGLKSEIIELGAVTRWLSGGTPSRSIDEFWNGYIPWISATTLKKINVSESDQCVTAEAVASGSKMAPIDSTLLLVRGSALHNEIRAGIVCSPVCFNQDVKALIPDKSVYPKYLTYSILGRESDLLKLVSSAGNTAGVLDTKLVQGFKIWLPSYDEQRAIATALSDVDALLDGLDRLIVKKRDLKQAAMQQLLTGKTRLPGFDDDWKCVKLGDIASIKTGKKNNEDKVEDGEYPFFVRSAYVERINTYSHDCEAILVPGEGNIGSIYHYVNGRFDVHQRVYAITQFCSDISARYIHAYMSQYFGNWAFQNSVKATVDSLRLPTFQTFELKIPSVIEEQIAISNILSDIASEICALEQHHHKIKNIKQAMMQELLTGKTRLVKPGDCNA